MKYTLLLLLALAGCKQAQPPTQVINSTGDGNVSVNSTESTAPEDVAAARYVKDHDCKVDLIHKNYAEFDYRTGGTKINPGYTYYHCKNPDVYVYVDFGGRE